MIVAALLGSQTLAGLAGLCLGTASGLFAGAGLVSGQHETRQGTYRRATVHFWAMTVVMVVFVVVFAAAGGMILTGMLEAGFGGS